MAEQEHPSVLESVREAVNSGTGSESPAETFPEAVDELGPPVDSSKSGADESPTTDDRPRGPDGKFVEKPKDVRAQVRSQVTKGRQAPLAIPAAAVAAPQHWPEEDKQWFAGLPDDAARQRWLDKNKRLESGYEKKFQEVAAWKRATEPFQKYLQQMSVPPEQAVPYLLNLSQMAKFGTPEEKRWALQQFAQAHDVPFGIPQNGAPQQDTPAARPGVTPEIEQAEQALLSLPRMQAAMQKLDRLDSEFSSRQQQILQAERDRINNAVLAFQNEVDSSGQPKNKYLGEVQDDIKLLIHAYEVQNGRKPGPEELPNLYKQACRMNEAVHAKIVAEQSAAAEAKRQAEAKARAAQARTAGASVSGAPVGGAASDMPASQGSVREDVRRAVAQARGRV